MKFLLDTNICIYIIKQKPPKVLQKFKTYKVGDIAISSITVAELEFGVHKSQFPERNRQALTQFLSPLRIVDFDINAANVYGKLRAKLEQQGTPIGALDTLIAAQALSLEITLITNNVREFERISDLKLDNWTI
ncbi:MAG: type II toxin-antitoxin system VapC family toxin [Xenococcaceae cyanobacterium MO_188.B29]|nr:type II toxin-antitoxin system VapC family toxin [Xenococcaceae cyanobacterium MO_188.B29]